MAYDASVALVNTDGNPFPDTTAVNASGPGATDGTEFVKILIDNYMFGPQQALLDWAGLTPDGSSEAVGTAQTIEALQKGFGAPPGVVTEWNLASDPGTTGHRALQLNGQGILRANYPELDAAVYVGDGNNGTSDAYYRADDAAGTIRNIVGIYLILPESRGHTVRGLDTAASVDPDGASRTIGHLQSDAFQGHWFNLAAVGGTGIFNSVDGTGPSVSGRGINSGAVATQPAVVTTNPITDGVNGTPRTSSESRMTNRATKFVIWY